MDRQVGRYETPMSKQSARTLIYLSIYLSIPLSIYPCIHVYMYTYIHTYTRAPAQSHRFAGASTRTCAYIS